MFIIRINAFREYSMELSEFLEGFIKSYSYNFNMILSPDWQAVINSQRNNFGNVRSCIDYISMLQHYGEPFVILTKYDNNVRCFVDISS